MFKEKVSKKEPKESLVRPNTTLGRLKSVGEDHFGFKKGWLPVRSFTYYELKNIEDVLNQCVVHSVVDEEHGFRHKLFATRKPGGVMNGAQSEGYVRRVSDVTINRMQEILNQSLKTKIRQEKDIKFLGSKSDTQPTEK